MTDQPDTPDTFNQWAIVDVMGHQRYAGRVTEQVLAGTGFIRVDVPEAQKPQYDGTVQTLPAMTKLFSPSAIHSISPCTEEVARTAAASVGRSEPIDAYDVRRAGYQLKALPAEQTTGPDTSVDDTGDDYDDLDPMDEPGDDIPY